VRGLGFLSAPTQRTTFSPPTHLPICPSPLQDLASTSRFFHWGGLYPINTGCQVLVFVLPPRCYPSFLCTFSTNTFSITLSIVWKNPRFRCFLRLNLEYTFPQDFRCHILLVVLPLFARFGFERQFVDFYSKGLPRHPHFFLSLSLKSLGPLCSVRFNCVYRGEIPPFSPTPCCPALWGVDKLKKKQFLAGLLVFFKCQPLPKGFLFPRVVRFAYSLLLFHLKLYRFSTPVFSLSISA